MMKYINFGRFGKTKTTKYVEHFQLVC